MYYTIGWYPDKLVKSMKKTNILKLGKTTDYIGGIVFSNMSEIKDYVEKMNIVNKDFWVLKLLSCLESDIYYFKGHKHLLKSKTMKKYKRWK